MRVLVTGNEGYIGSILVPMLQTAGHEVIGLDSGLYRECALSAFPSVPTLRRDVREVGRADLDGVDAIIHLAGLSNDPLGDLDPELTYAINYDASVRLAQLAKAVGVRRFLYASSCSVYGAAGEIPVDESAPLRPLTPYAKSKALAEADIRQLADEHFSPVYLRAATAYGISPFLRFDLALNNLVAWAHTTGRVYLKSDGQGLRPFVHVEDIARAYVALLHAPRERVHNQVFNVGRSEENYRIRDIAEIVREVVPGTRVEFAADASPDRRCYAVSCEYLARTVPDYRPRWTARAGVEEVYGTIRPTTLTSDQFEGPRYNRIAYIRYLLGESRIDSSLHWAPQAKALEPLGRLW